jgi:hypothetical protein
MSNKGSAPSRTCEATVLRFVSRAQQLRLRGRRNYDRYMLFTKGFVKADGPERAQWQRESLRNLWVTRTGTSSMALSRVARAFSSGDTNTNSLRGT